MLGVPRSRGCNLCRKQRKKCDTSQTPCPRCRRLGLPCIGPGEQRFKFRDESRKWVVTQHPGPNGRPVALSRLPRMIPSPSPRMLSNETTSLTSAFVGRIEEVVDALPL